MIAYKMQFASINERIDSVGQTINNENPLMTAAWCIKIEIYRFDWSEASYFGWKKGGIYPGLIWKMSAFKASFII